MPAGEYPLAGSEKSALPVTVREKIPSLDQRVLLLPEMIAMGEALGEKHLLPPKVRGFLDSSLAQLKEGEGLRIRLKFDTYALADLPWEFAYIPHPDTPRGQKGLEGFLLLDRRISWCAARCLARRSPRWSRARDRSAWRSCSPTSTDLPTARSTYKLSAKTSPTC